MPGRYSDFLAAAPREVDTYCVYYVREDFREIPLRQFLDSRTARIQCEELWRQYGQRKTFIVKDSENPGQPAIWTRLGLDGPVLGKGV